MFHVFFAMSSASAGEVSVQNVPFLSVDADAPSDPERDFFRRFRVR